MDDDEIDPRIQIELENLNTATDEINKLEIELEEANSTFRILLNESTRRLKLLTKKLGSCIEKARPFYDSVEKSRLAQIECQTAAVKFQRANEIHAAAKETVALAEKRFMSNSHDWSFDNAWQEMLNHATIKVMEAEKQKQETNAEHQKKAMIFSAAELKVQQLEERFRRSIHKSRPYFDEKQICQDQLQTQKERIQLLQSQIQISKSTYSNSLRNLEQISEDIHRKRGDLCSVSPGQREPGVGAELSSLEMEQNKQTKNIKTPISPTQQLPAATSNLNCLNTNVIFPLPDFNLELDRCEIRSAGSTSVATSSAVSEKDMNSEDDDDELNLEILRQKVKVLAVRPMEGGDGQQEEQVTWENELNATVNKLDHLMMIRECSKFTNNNNSLPSSPNKTTNSQITSINNHPIKMLKMADPLPLLNVSMNVLPTLSTLQLQQTLDNNKKSQFTTDKRRKFSF